MKIKELKHGFQLLARINIKQGLRFHNISDSKIFDSNYIWNKIYKIKISDYKRIINESIKNPNIEIEKSSKSNINNIYNSENNDEYITLSLYCQIDYYSWEVMIDLFNDMENYDIIKIGKTKSHKNIKEAKDLIMKICNCFIIDHEM